MAIKIQRPHISNVIETDLEILQDLAVLAEHRLKWAAKYQVRDMIEEFSKALRAELDYTIEARNADKFSKQSANEQAVYIPKVFWEYSTKRVLTMEYVEGIKLNEIEKLKTNGYHLDHITEILSKEIFRQIFMDGFFMPIPILEMSSLSRAESLPSLISE